LTSGAEPFLWLRLETKLLEPGACIPTLSR
jgi:hypothetical protein